MKINKLIIDSSDSITDLCRLGTTYPTDKSPYNTNDLLHKHPYTAIYDLLFSSIRWKNIKIAEIGIFENNSIKCWRKYFVNAHIFGFESYLNFITNAINDNLINTKYIQTDVKDLENFDRDLSLFSNYDIIIDDSTHEFNDQINIINISWKYLNPGGTLIIEDVFIDEDENKYADSIKQLTKYFSSILFIEAHHNLKYSAGWNNDKLLILIRNDVS